MICEYCTQEKDDVEKRRQNTQYVDDERNFVTSCETCYLDLEDYWADMWAEVYSGWL